MTGARKASPPLLSADVSRLRARARSTAIQDVLPIRHPEQEHNTAALARPDTPQSQPRLQPQPLKLKRRTFTPPKTKKAARQQRLLRLEKYALIAAAPVVIIVSVRLSAYPLIGEGTVGLYGLCALVLRIPGRVSFWLASMVLVSIGVEFLFFPQTNRPNNTALFVFLLLAIGFVSLVFETRRMDVGNKRSRRR